MRSDYGPLMPLRRCFDKREAVFKKEIVPPDFSTQRREKENPLPSLEHRINSSGIPNYPSRVSPPNQGWYVREKHLKKLEERQKWGLKDGTRMLN